VDNSDLAKEFLDYIYERSGLFSSSGGANPTFNFPHRSLQEYLAGCHMMKMRGNTKTYLQRAAEGSYWSEAALLGAEDVVDNPSISLNEVFNLLYGLCPQKQPPKNEQWERALLWAGQISVKINRKQLENDAKSLDTTKNFLRDLTKRTSKIFESSKFLSPRECAEAGITLAKLGDPRFDPDRFFLPKEPMLGFVHIPADDFLMGTKEEDIPKLVEKFGGEEDLYKDETPQHPVPVESFYIARYPVTVAQFKKFVEDKKDYTPSNTDSLRGVDNHPVRYVSWYDAMEYCKWLTEKLKEIAPNFKGEENADFWRGIESGKYIVTLPSEAEWEYAARGKQGRNFPWEANEIKPEYANYAATNINTASTVGMFLLGKTPEGLYDMAGNVWEWTRSNYKEYPYKKDDGREDTSADKNVARVLRGGAYYDNERRVRCASRNDFYPHYWSLNFGFRVVCVVSPISL